MDINYTVFLLRTV